MPLRRAVAWSNVRSRGVDNTCHCSVTGSMCGPHVHAETAARVRWTRTWHPQDIASSAAGPSGASDAFRVWCMPFPRSTCQRPRSPRRVATWLRSAIPAGTGNARRSARSREYADWLRCRHSRRSEIDNQPSQKTARPSTMDTSCENCARACPLPDFGIEVQSHLAGRLRRDGRGRYDPGRDTVTGRSTGPRAYRGNRVSVAASARARRGGSPRMPLRSWGPVLRFPACPRRGRRAGSRVCRRR